ncbi:hypothetical protein BMF94_6739 [Rhodotorula taiwanensis]|uniref:Uncharacterized protein n=1 Tax=Rhodotorula taiwanensis TaxID=741276 RepID=A0A2S5B057_9BASI|nr:hypothetical protein BMF94_6739 [Rhodotorula taiwanensis]
MSGSIHDLIDEALAHAQAVWESVVPADLSNLHDLGGKVANSLDDLLEKITNNGTLPVPNPRDWLPEQLQPAPSPSAAPAPLAAHSSASAWLHRFAQHTARHPYAYATAAIGLTGGASYYWAPHATLRVLEPFTSWVPVALLPDPADRPLRLTPAQHGVAGEVRKEAVVVLGADSPHGRELALDLERRGFVVIATVADPANVDALERSSRGWLKVLVLDPHESSSVSPFLRSLSTALSLRYPLHSSGDPFSRPAHALALTGVVNCLSLAPTTAGADAPYPLEATESDAVRRQVGERVATVVGALKGLLPILRSAASRPGAPTGVLISLVPSANSNLSLPFASLASAADAAISSVLHSLRREVAASTSTNVRLTALEVGFFQTTPVPTTMAAQRASNYFAPLPIRLESVYAPALARRSPLDMTNTSEAASPAGKSARKGTEMRKLCKRVWQILARPAHAGAVARVGSGAWTYLFVSYLPHAVIDVCLGVQDRLYGIYFNHVRELVTSRRGRAIDSAQPGPSTRGPLPTPPASRGGPFRPGPAQVPLADPFMPTPSPAPSSSRGGGGAGGGGYSSCDEASSQSSTEDFGPLGGSGYVSGSASMGGSFVSVGRDEAE